VFKDESIRNIMVNILFVYCKERPALSYRQAIKVFLDITLSPLPQKKHPEIVEKRTYSSFALKTYDVRTMN
jgi:hypothetical protein